MNKLWRAILVFSLALVGLYAGGILGATYLVPKGAGLAGGPMVLGYAALGVVIGVIVGLLVASLVKGQALRNIALIVGIPVLIGSLVLGVRVLLQQASEREPESAFAAAGEFTVMMERLDISDPFLFVKMKIDSRDRTWTQTGPAPELVIYYAKMKAEHLIELREALENVARLSAEDIADCHSDKGLPTKRLEWNLIDAKSSENGQDLISQGVVDINAACLQEHFVISRALQLVEKASLVSGGPVKQQ